MKRGSEKRSAETMGDTEKSENVFFFGGGRGETGFSFFGLLKRKQTNPPKNNLKEFWMGLGPSEVPRRRKTNPPKMKRV